MLRHSHPQVLQLRYWHISLRLTAYTTILLLSSVFTSEGVVFASFLLARYCTRNSETTHRVQPLRTKKAKQTLLPASSTSKSKHRYNTSTSRAPEHVQRCYKSLTPPFETPLLISAVTYRTSCRRRYPPNTKRHESQKYVDVEQVTTCCPVR